MSQTVEAFYNSINLQVADLETAKIKGNAQERRIYELMKATGKEYTPFEIQELYQMYWFPVPITSIRRAMTNLESKGIIKKTGNMKPEQYGKPNHTWVINQKSFKQTKLEL